MKLHLISHDLCPYVQRAVISLSEKGVEFERSYIDLAKKPIWFAHVLLCHIDALASRLTLRSVDVM